MAPRGRDRALQLFTVLEGPGSHTSSRTLRRFHPRLVDDGFVLCCPVARIHPDSPLPPPFTKHQFIDDVDAYMAGKDPEGTLHEMQALYQQYKQIEQGLQQNRIRLGNKLPEIKRALDTVKLLCDKQGSGEELDMHFELTDSVYAKAKVKDAESVYLWLGANVMLEYPLGEALELLQTNHKNCKNNLATNQGDLAFVKDNITITEVSIARVYNWDVKKRKEEGEKK